MKPKRLLYDTGKSQAQELYDALSKWAKKYNEQPKIYGGFRHTPEEDQGQHLLEKVWHGIEHES